VNENDAPALNREIASQRQRRQVEVVVAPHRFDWGDLFKGGDRLGAADIARMEDEIDPAKSFEDAIGEAIEELRTVGVRDDPDPRRQLLDPGRLQPGRVGAFGVGAPVERMQGRRGEKVRAGLVEVQVDVGEGKPGAVGLATGVYSLWRRAHRGRCDLGSGGDVLAARQCGEGGLRRGMARVDWRPASFRPRKPFGVGTVLWRWDDSVDVDVDVLLVDDLP
jgi:hypothetical protein